MANFSNVNDNNALQEYFYVSDGWGGDAPCESRIWGAVLDMYNLLDGGKNVLIEEVIRSKWSTPSVAVVCYTW